jgi:hypothetical protein
MDYKAIIITLGMSAAIFYAGEVRAQDDSEISKSHQQAKDSLQRISANEARLQKTNDETRMTAAKHDKKQTKAKAKNARRIENDANTAARESRSAMRAERRAQKSRRQANDQAEKASKARNKSDRN